MAGFFKSFGKGILYVLVLPFLVVVLALFGVFGLLGFLFMLIKGLILFFTGRSLFDPLPEDVKAEKIIKANTVNLDPDAPENQPKEGHVAIGPTYGGNQTSSDPFYVPEYLKANREDIEIPSQQPEEISHRDVEQIDYTNAQEELNNNNSDIFMEDKNDEPQEEENSFSNFDDDNYEL